MNNHWRGFRVWSWLVPGLIVLVAGLLIGPRIADDQQRENCVVNVRLLGPLGISLNCDSPEYLRLAHEPSGLLEVDNTRQSRPGIILAASAISVIFSPLRHLPKWFDIAAQRQDIDPRRISGALASQFPAYFAYLTINISVLLLTFFVFLQILGEVSLAPEEHPVIAGSVGVLLVANDVTKAYFYSPHSQMFNVFGPVFAMWATVRTLNGALKKTRFATIAGLITGFGMTGYPTFALVILCVAASATLSFIYRRALPRPELLNLGLFFAAAISPMACWYAFVWLRTGSAYVHEFTGPTTWISESYDILSVASTILKGIEWLIEQAAPQCIPIGVLAALMCAAAVLAPRSFEMIWHKCKELVIASVIVSVIFAVFFSCTGTMAARWAYTPLPPIVILLGAMLFLIAGWLQAKWRFALGVALFLLGWWQVFYTIAKNGPFT